MPGTGSASADFGSISAETTVVITGQSAITTASLVGGWTRIMGNASHSLDEHMAEDLVVQAGSLVAGVGFTLYVKPRYGRTGGTFDLNWAWV